MNIKLIYLHIRKTAGSSFRILAIDTYGVEQVFWFWDDLAEELYDKICDPQIKIIGGHISFQNCQSIPPLPRDIMPVFAVMTRHPVERVVSLFNHHRTKSKWQGMVDGFDANSLRKTLKNCQQFRFMCCNDQCHAISGKRSFNKVLEVVENNNFIVGCLDHVDMFINQLSNMFGWKAHRISQNNRAYGVYKKKIKIDLKTLGLMKEIMAEDFKLYHFLKKKMIHVSPKLDSCHLEKVHTQYFPHGQITSNERAKVKIELGCAAIVTVAPGEKFFIPVMITSKASIVIQVNSQSGIKISYHVFNEYGELLLWDGVRTQLQEDIVPNKMIHVQAEIIAPLEVGKYHIKLGLTHDPIAWFESDNREHEKEIVLCVKA